jgi:S1-C subfamily serine protease
MVKDFLSQKGINFEERDVSENPAYAQELVSTTGQMGVPATIINGQAIIGFDRPRLEEAVSRQQRPSLGAAVADADRITMRKGTEVTAGAYVGKVRSGSLAEKMGLTSGDIIVEVNKQKIANAADLEKEISRTGEGNRIFLVFIRDNNRRAAEGILF